MLRDRLRTSAVLISVAIGLLLLDAKVVIPGAEGIWLLPLLLFFGLGTAWEMATMLLSGGHPIRRVVALASTAIVCLSSVVPMAWALSEEDYPVDCPIGRLGWIVLGAVVAMFVILLAEMRQYGIETEDKSEVGDTIRRTCGATFVSLYVGLPMAMLVALRSMNASDSQGRFGLAALITMIFVTKVADAGAYFTGKAIGKHKLIPRLSPGKTIEGSLGGIVASTVVAFFCLEYLFPWICPASPLGGTIAESAGSAPGADAVGAAVKTGLAGILSQPIWGALVLGPTLAITGMIGDLAESLFKRDAGVKDSGNLLPGLGGVWDVTDSLLAASIPAFFWFASGVGGQ